MFQRHELYVVTGDGHRPWHRRFAVRQLADGRRVAYWWGTHSPERYTARDRIFALRREHRDEFEMLGLGDDDLQAIHNALGGAAWAGDPRLAARRGRRASPHPGGCSTDGFIGIAFLPDPPECWMPDSVWPGWRHLAHYRYWPKLHAPPEGWCEAELTQTWAWLEAATDEDLAALLEPFPRGGGQA